MRLSFQLWLVCMSAAFMGVGTYFTVFTSIFASSEVVTSLLIAFFINSIFVCVLTLKILGGVVEKQKELV